ncbi:MAG: transglutaminase family protein [Verrucomicrobiota bacterium]
MNLLCAEGLRGSEDLDVSKYIERLNSLARQVEWETKRNEHRFTEHPEEHKNSLAYYRMGMLGTVLAEDYGMRYNPKLEIPWVHGKRTDQQANYANSKNVFIHGLLAGERFGTCASMPVLYTAIARRLGYPVNLAATKYHLYVRYEQEDGGHLNVEATENRGFTTPTDEEYRKGPFPSTEEQIRDLGWLRPMTGREMLGAFLFARAGCLRNMERYAEEAEAIANAGRYLPDTPLSRRTIQACLERAQNSKNAGKWDQLWTEVDGMYVPPGPEFAQFQNRKVQVHMRMSQGTDLPAMEQAVGDLRRDLADYHRRMIEPTDAPRTNIVMLPPPSPTPILVLRVTLPSGKELVIPEEFLPPFENRQIPSSSWARIGAAKLDNEQSILTELWKHYETSMLARQKDSQAGNQSAVASGPTQARRMAIQQERIPAEYFWNGFPLELQQRLRKLDNEQEMVEEMHLYYAEELHLRNMQASESLFNSGHHPFLPPEWQPKDHLKLADFARESGIPANSIPWSYRNRELSPELQKRIVSRTRSITFGKETAVMDEVRRFESDERQKESALQVIQARRHTLDQIPLMQPPLHIDIIPAAPSQSPPGAPAIIPSVSPRMPLTVPVGFETKLPMIKR